MSSGDCALYDHEPAGECTPACDGFCNANGVCEPYPEPAYALPYQEPVTDYGVTAPPIDDDNMVLRYGVPFDD